MKRISWGSLFIGVALVLLIQMFMSKRKSTA